MAPPRPRHLAFVVCLFALASFGCSKKEASKEELLSRANDHFAADHYRAAEVDYREVLRLAPGDPDATRQLALIYYSQGELPQAFGLLRRSAELKPDDLDIQVKLALTYLATRQFAQAHDAAMAILDKHPGNEEALGLLADTVATPDEVADTQKLFQDLRAKDTDHPGYHLALGQLALRQNDQAHAESEFKAALALDPKSIATHLALARLYWTRKELKQADESFKAAADLSPPRGPARMAYADFKRQTGAVAEAKLILEDVNRKVPDALPPRVYLMKLACGEHAEDCSTRIQDILKQDPLNFDARLISGTLTLAAKDGTKAVQEFEQLRRLYPGVPQVRYELAVAYLLENKNPEAIDTAINNLNVALELNPHFDPAAVLLAQLRMRKGQFAAAVDGLAGLIKENPQIPQARYLLASAYLAQRNVEQALAVYRGMVEQFPKDPQPSVLIGTILLEQRKPQEARKALEKSLEISPDYAPATEKLIDLDIAEKQYANAIKRAQALIDKDPKAAQAWAIRAKIYLAQKDYPRAEEDLKKAIELDPQLARAYVWLAQLYVASNRQDQAIQQLNALLEKKADAPSLTLLAAIHEQMKHFDEARTTYEKLVALDPKSVVGLNNLAYLYALDPARLDTAYDLARRARALVPDEPHVADTFGWILFKKHEYGNAVPVLQESAGKLPDEPDVQFHLGMAAYMLGDEIAARTALQKAADTEKDSASREEARRQLSVLAIDAKTADASARAMLENYLRDQPNDPVALVRLAQLQQRDGEVEPAIKNYEAVVSANPQFASATRALALLYVQRSADDPKAYDLVAKARLANPGDPELAKTLGILTYRRGTYPRSLELLQEAAAKRKDDPELVYYLGMTFYQLKQFADAKETLQRALSLKLPGDLAEEAKRALADCCQDPDQN